MLSEELVRFFNEREPTDVLLLDVATRWDHCPTAVLCVPLAPLDPESAEEPNEEFQPPV